MLSLYLESAPRMFSGSLSAESEEGEETEGEEGAEGEEGTEGDGDEKSDG